MDPYTSLATFLGAGVLVIGAIAVLGTLLVGGKPDRRLSEHSPSNFPYRSAGPLFSPAERSFLGVLESVVDDQHRVFGKVRVADLIKVNKTSDRKAWAAAFSRIKAKHFDFVLVKRSDLSVVCVIELDDKSHQSSKAQARDVFIDGACKAAGLPLVRVPARASYTRDDVRSRLAAAVTDKAVKSDEDDVTTIANAPRESNMQADVR